MSHTKGDFWELVWQFRTPTIVLLTNFMEGTQVRMFQLLLQLQQFIYCHGNVAVEELLYMRNLCVSKRTSYAIIVHWVRNCFECWYVSRFGVYTHIICFNTNSASYTIVMHGMHFEYYI